MAMAPAVDASAATQMNLAFITRPLPHQNKKGADRLVLWAASNKTRFGRGQCQALNLS